jgi:hypothetical protein
MRTGACVVLTIASPLVVIANEIAPGNGEFLAGSGGDGALIFLSVHHSIDISDRAGG